MEIGTKEFYQEVINEARNLKKFATRAERKRLNIYQLSNYFTTTCWYGLLTGNSRSERACELKAKSSKLLTWSLVKKDIDLKQFDTNNESFPRSAYTPLEALFDDNNSELQVSELLLPFLRGETRIWPKVSDFMIRIG